jgi:hypothetical protein
MNKGHTLSRFIFEQKFIFLKLVLLENILVHDSNNTNYALYNWDIAPQFLWSKFALKYTRLIHRSSILSYTLRLMYIFEILCGISQFHMRCTLVSFFQITTEYNKTGTISNKKSQTLSDCEPCARISSLQQKWRPLNTLPRRRSRRRLAWAPSPSRPPP